MGTWVLPGVLGVVGRHGPVWPWPPLPWVTQRIQVSLVMDVTKKSLFLCFLEVLEMYSFQSPERDLI